MSEFTGRVALIAGANRGIRLEVVRQLALRGFTAILGARDASFRAAIKECMSS